MKIAMIGLCLLLFTGCAVGGAPQGAVAGCGDFEYIGTWTKSRTDMRVLWLSETGNITVEQAITLAEAMGCNRD